MPTQTDNNQTLVTEDGRKITWARYRYEQALKQQALLARVDSIAASQGRELANLGMDFSNQDFGGYLRSTLPQLLDQFGNVNARAAVDHFDNMRLQWYQLFGDTVNASRKGRKRLADRYGVAATQGALYKAGINPEDFKAQFAEGIDAVNKTDKIMNFVMKVRARDGHEPSVTALENAMTREVASYHRDTMLFNSALDPYAGRVQRVAQATACEFCRLMALGSTNGKVRVSSYAIKFHSHCHCTIETLWGSDEPVRPDYYDDFEKQYEEASRNSDGSAKGILAEMRQLQKQPVTAAATSTKFDVKKFMSDETADHVGMMNSVFGSRDFNGFKVEYERRMDFDADNLVTMRGNILSPDGFVAGDIARTFKLDNGSLIVKHELLELKKEFRGQGFSTEFSKFSEDFYRSVGVKKITLDAGLQDGAYTWAKAGYTWEAGSEPIVISFNKWDELQNRGFSDEAARLRALRKKMDDHTVDWEEYPQPFEIANMKGPDIDGMPFGRWLLKDEYWSGEKTL
jgi:hypothetical protein